MLRRRQEAIKRLQAIRQLGVVKQEHGISKWSSNDYGIQNQALRTISELTATLPRAAPPDVNSKEALRDSVECLAGLLSSTNLEVRLKAAATSSALVSSIDSGAASYTLFSPLACLFISSGDRETIIPAAAAMRTIIQGLKSTSTELHGVVNTMNDLQIIRRLASSLETTTRGDSELVAALGDLLAVALVRLPGERYITGSRSTLRRVLYEHCSSGDEAEAAASLRALSSLCLCSGVAALILEDMVVVLSILQRMLRFPNGKVEALHFLVCLMSFSSFLSRLERYDLGFISQECVEVLKSFPGEDKKLSAEEERLYLLAACSTSLLLSVPGDHRSAFLRAGIVPVLYSALHTRSRSQASKEFRSSLNSYLWEAAGFLGPYSDEKADEPCLIDLIRFCCFMFKNVVTSCDYSSQESLQICHAALLLVYSPSPRCSSHARRALEECSTSLHPVVELISEGYFNAWRGVKSLQARLYAISICSSIRSFKEEFLRRRVLNSLANLIRKRSQGEPEWFSSSSSCSRVPSLAMLKPCCSEGRESWSGRDRVLFASLWGANLLLCGENNPDACEFLLKIFSDENQSPGARILGAFGLSRFGIYGFSSGLGKSLSKLLEENSFADVRFLFAGGGFLLAHRVVLIARCPALLSASSVQGSETIVRLSARVSRRALEKVLRFVYTGQMQLSPGDDEKQEVKILARKLRLEHLRSLLENETPRVGSVPEKFTLEPALGKFSDIVLRCTRSTDQEDHLYAHRAILACRSDYFGALFRSGMRDSSAMVIDVPERKPVTASYLEFIYTNKIQVPITACEWKALELEQQWEVLERLIDLAALAEEWLSEELWEACIEKASSGLRRVESPVLCCRAMQHAADKQQPEIVFLAAEISAPRYIQLRESGEIDFMSDELQDFLRTRFVELKSSSTSAPR